VGSGQSPVGSDVPTGDWRLQLATADLKFLPDEIF